MSHIKCKSLIITFEEKIFLQYAAICSINIHEMVPKIIHDPEIDKFRKSELDYNFLDLSAYYGNYTAFEFFLNKVPYQIILESSNHFPLIFYALKGKNKQIIKLITQRGKTNEVFFSLYHGLYYSLKLGDIHYLNKFFKKAKKQRPDDSSETVLYDIFLSSDHKPRSPLKLAIKSRNLLCVGFILNISQREIPILIETKQGKRTKKNAITPLHIAARYGCGDIAYLLISLEPKMLTKKGTNKYFYPFVDVIKYNLAPQRYEEYFKHGKKDKYINLKDEHGNGALHYAIKHGNINAVCILLKENNIDVNLKGEEGKRPIHLAAQLCNNEILMELLKFPTINLEEKDDYGNLAIHDAAESNWDEGFYIILEEMAKKRKKKRELLQYNISKTNNSTENTSQPSFFSFSPKSSPETIFQQSNNISNLNNFSISLNRKSFSNVYTNTSERNENYSNNFGMTEMMVPSEKDIDDEILQFIEDLIFTQNKSGLCCFHIAALKNCGKIFDCLENKYPMIAQKIYEYNSGLTGFTVLHYLAMCGHDKLLDKILINHPSINIDVQGIDPIVSSLYQASKFNHENCVKVLIQHGASIQKMSKRKRDIKSYVHTEYMNSLLMGIENKSIDQISQSFHCDPLEVQ